MAVVEEHREIESAEVHTVYRKVFADEAARLADAGPYKTVELNIKAIQVDTAIEYRLTVISPVTWTAVGAVGGGGVQGGAFPSANKRVTQSLATIAQGGDVTVELAGLTVADIITANAGFLALSIWIMARYSGGNVRQEQYTALIALNAGPGDPNTRIAGAPELNLLSVIGDDGVNASLADLVGATGIIEIQFMDGDGTAGTVDVVVVATLSDYYER